MSNQPEAPKPETMDLRALIIDAMRDAWNDICSDTNCHPDDISHEGRRLFFEPGHWASQTADIVASKIEAVSAALAAKPETDFDVIRDEVIPYLRGYGRGRWADAIKAAHTALSARLAEVERERDVAKHDAKIIMDMLRDQTQRKDKWIVRAETAENALATAQGQLAEMQDIVHAAVRFIAADINVTPNLSREEAVRSGYAVLNEAVDRWHSNQPASAARAAGKGTES